MRDRPICSGAGAMLAALAIMAGCSADSEIGGATVQDRTTVDAMDAIFAEFDDTSPGCAVAVRDRAGVEHHAQYGMADLDIGQPITVETVFDIASVSKQLTGGVIALLVLDGDLALDDDVTDIVPELGPFDEVITVADLLHHSSGLPDYTELLDADDDEITTMDDALQVIGSADGAPVADPGTEFEYSNTNYVLLATIIERITDERMADVAADQIFSPLGMDATLVRDDQGELLDRQAQGYAETDGGWEPTGSWWRQTGDGAVHSTPLDLLRWAELFVETPTQDGLGSDAWLDVMLTPGVVPDGDDAYGGGVELVEDDGGPLVRHGGSWLGYGSALTIRPSTGVAVAVTCNIDGIEAEELADETLDIWEAAG